MLRPTNSLFAIGQETTNALAAEQRHRAAHQSATSPLASVTYDALADELDLHGFVESPVDGPIRRFVSDYRTRGEEDRARIRCALSMEDFHTLLTFARRCVFASLQQHDGLSLQEGLEALTAIDQDRIDKRDVSQAAALLNWAMRRRGVDP